MHTVKRMRSPRVIGTITNRNLVTGLAALIAVVLWASAFAGIRASLADYGPYHLALFRWLASSVIFLLLALIKPLRMPSREHIPLIALTGLLGIVGYSVLLNLGELTVTASAASFIVNTVPIQTAVLSAFLLREKITQPLLVSMLTGLLGVGLIAFGEKSSVNLFNTGALLILLAALSQAIYFISQKKLLKHYTPLEVVSYTSLSGTAILFVFVPGLAQTIMSASSSATISVLYIGVFPGAIGYLIWTFVLSRMPAAKATQFLYLVPFVAMIISYFWLFEIPSLKSLGGGIIVLLGLVYLLSGQKSAGKHQNGARGASI